MKLAPIGNQKTVTAYARAIERMRNDGIAWLVFKIPPGAAARQFGEYGCCLATERADYEAGGAEFIA